jgi:anti-sigma regulatory factor (Ser/Thr protein kinase)
MEAFPRLAAFLDDVGRAEGLARRDALRLRLVVEELFTNTVRHGRLEAAEGPGEVSVEVSVTVDPEAVTLVYEDAAPPHDPRRALGGRGETGGPEDRVGGLGMRLVSGVARRLGYETVTGRNRVTVVLGRAPAAP